MQDLPLRLVRRRSEELLVVFTGQVIAEQEQSGEVDLSPLDHPESNRILADEACGSDAATCFIIAQSEPSNAKVPKRGTRGFEIEPSLFDLGEIGEQARENHASLADKRMETREQIVVGQIL
jgi:hypothetical protein